MANQNYTHIRAEGHSRQHNGDVHGGVVYNIGRDVSPIEKKCLRSLWFLQRSDIKERTEGTCQWAVDSTEYRSWLHDGGVLLIEGGSGRGKSTLMMDLLSQAQQRAKNVQGSSALVLSFFFSKKNNSELQQTFIGLLRSLMHQVLRSSGGAMQEFIHSSDLQSRLDDQGEPDEKWSWTDRDLHLPLKRSIETHLTSRAIEVYIDGLDESAEDDTTDIERFLTWMSKLVRPRVLVCMASQKCSRFSWPTRLRLTMDHNEDVERYLRGRFSSFGSDAPVLINEVRNKACGNFQWAVLASQRLLCQEKSVRGSARYPARLVIEAKDLPKDLTELHTRILDDVDVRQAILLLRVCSWVANACRPLSLEELKDAVQMDPAAGTGLVNRTDLGVAKGIEAWKEQVLSLARGFLVVSTITRRNMMLRRSASSSRNFIRDLDALSHGMSSTTVEEPDSPYDSDEEEVQIVQFDHVSTQEYMIKRGLDELRAIIARHDLNDLRAPMYDHSYLALTLLRCLGDEHAFLQYTSWHWTNNHPLTPYALDHCKTHAEIASQADSFQEGLGIELITSEFELWSSSSTAGWFARSRSISQWQHLDKHWSDSAPPGYNHRHKVMESAYGMKMKIFDIWLPDDNARSALEIAVEKGNFMAVYILLRLGALDAQGSAFRRNEVLALSPSTAITAMLKGSALPAPAVRTMGMFASGPMLALYSEGLSYKVNNFGGEWLQWLWKLVRASLLDLKASAEKASSTQTNKLIASSAVSEDSRSSHVQVNSSELTMAERIRLAVVRGAVRGAKRGIAESRRGTVQSGGTDTSSDAKPKTLGEQNKKEIKELEMSFGKNRALADRARNTFQ